MFTHRKLQVEARAHILTLYSHPPKTTQLCHDLLHMGCTQVNQYKHTGTSSYAYPVFPALSAIALPYLAGGPVWNGLITVTAAAAC